MSVESINVSSLYFCVILASLQAARNFIAVEKPKNNIFVDSPSAVFRCYFFILSLL